MVDLSRRRLMETSLAAALGASVTGVAGADEVPESDTPGAPSVRGELKRFASTAFGAEVTGPFVFEDGTLLYSLQHPEGSNPEPFGRAAVGYFSGFGFEFDGDNDDFEEVGIPETDAEQRRVRSANGDYEILVQGRQPIADGAERLGVAQTPGGTDVTSENFPGSGGGAGGNPDCNGFVATDEDGTEGYLFTNWENTPGSISRVPVSREDDGSWSADPETATNVVNSEAFRDIGGTRINCYGDLSPWDTMLSAEENYGHPRVSYRHTVSDIVEAGTGEGIVGGCQFWNRPRPTGIGDAISTYVEGGALDEEWSPQGYWSQSGVERLAYYLGADPVPRDGDEGSASPIDDVYPNPYRYGYFVDVREPAAEEPQPIKYWVMGRAAWEAPDVQSDEKTVYGCSDGDSKGIYKFVADEPIPSYDDPGDVAGTLYAPKVTNDAANASEAGTRNSPAQTPLDVEWLELGHAKNCEVEGWIEAYDDVTQADYLDVHAETDWQESPEAARREADLEVIENGNQSYVTNEEIVEWAAQYEARGPDGVDEDLRKVPFLETRAAAKEIGASIEFNKAEGVDSAPGAGPGDFVYFGISEFNDALADESGDVQLDRVDGGVVYRAELEPDYDVSRLEPVITGPDFTDPPADANDALRNVDNVYVMRDGRVLCCEDGFGGPARSYPNDCLYVYEPNVLVDVAPLTVATGRTGTTALAVSSLPAGLSRGVVSVSVDDDRVATLVDAEASDAFADASVEVHPDGTTVVVRFGPAADAGPGAMDVPLATLTLRGKRPDTTDLDVTVERLEDADGAAIEAEGLGGSVATQSGGEGEDGDQQAGGDDTARENGSDAGNGNAGARENGAGDEQDDHEEGC